MRKPPPSGDSMTRRMLRLVRRLPAPIQAYVYQAIEDSAFLVILIVAMIVVVAVFIMATVVVGALNWLLGSPTGAVGIVLAYAWLATWTVLPIIITVRMWRAVPVFIQIRRIATDGFDGEEEVRTPRETPEPSALNARLAAADAALAPAGDSHDPSSSDDRPSP